jgi:hypothetical protein
MPLSGARIRSRKTQERDFKVGDFGGLYLWVKKAGLRWWRFKDRILGSEKLMVFGDYPHVSLAKARALRDEGKSTLAAGLDPSEKKRITQRVAEAAIKETFVAIGLVETRWRLSDSTPESGCVPVLRRNPCA